MCVAMLFGSLFTFPAEMKMLLKERSSGMYNLSAYYISRSAASMPLELLYPTVFTVLAYWMGALRPQVRQMVVDHGIIQIERHLIAISMGAAFQH